MYGYSKNKKIWAFESCYLMASTLHNCKLELFSFFRQIPLALFLSRLQDKSAVNSLSATQMEL